jgi:hypothetical protein
MPCAICNSSIVVASCIKCGVETCGSHTIYCHDCRKAVCKRHAHINEGGPRFCFDCFEARSQGGEDGDLGASPLQTEEGGESTSFAALVGDDEKTYTPEGVKKKKKPTDDRPILKSSGYQSPSKKAWAAAYFLFGASGVFFAIRNPGIMEITWPFGAGSIEFDEGQVAVSGGTSTLWSSNSMSNLNLFTAIPVFLLGWSLILAYAFGAFVIVKSILGGVIRDRF